MNLEEAKQKIATITPQLVDVPFVVLHAFERNGRNLQLALTERFYRACRKGKIWQSQAFLTAIKNAEYGFDQHLARSRGGRDGIFLLDRSYTPKNAMMTKLFDRYLDVPDRGAHQIAQKLGTEVAQLQAVRSAQPPY
jgi:lauroyl/myristoyl acyltransferase